MIIKLIQWNVWFKEKPANIARFLKASGADIICAQELIQDSRKNLDVAKYIAETLGYGYYYHGGDTWDNRPDKESQGNAIFSRWPIIGSRYAYVQTPKHNPPDSSHEGRVYVEVALKVGDKELTVGTTHLSHSDGFVITAERKKEIDILLDITKKRNRNYVFAGDLNSLPDSYAIPQLEKMLTPSGPAYDKKSWTTKPKEKEDKLNRRIDYVFNSRDIEVVDAKMLECTYSDHLPIRIEFEI